MFEMLLFPAIPSYNNECPKISLISALKADIKPCADTGLSN